MKRKREIPNLEEVIAFAVDLCKQGKPQPVIKSAIILRFGFTPRHHELAEWTRDVADWRYGSGSYRRFNLILWPEEYDYTAPGVNKLPIAHMVNPGTTEREPWRVYRGPVIRGERPYRVMPENGDPFVIWAGSFAGFLEGLRKIGIVATGYDPDEAKCEQVEMFTEARRMAA